MELANDRTESTFIYSRKIIALTVNGQEIVINPPLSTYASFLKLVIQTAPFKRKQ